MHNAALLKPLLHRKRSSLGRKPHRHGQSVRALIRMKIAGLASMRQGRNPRRSNPRQCHGRNRKRFRIRQHRRRQPGRRRSQDLSIALRRRASSLRNGPSLKSMRAAIAAGASIKRAVDGGHSS